MSSGGSSSGGSGGLAGAPAGFPDTPGWHEISGTTLRPVCADVEFPEVWGVEGCAAVMNDWSGGAFDPLRNRLIVTGGGHNGYYGNELYALDLYSKSFQRLNDPGLPAAPYACSSGEDCFGSCMISVANGTQPNSRHTYDGLEYMPTVDRLLIHSGSLACGLGSFGPDTWTFDFGSMSWSRVTATDGEWPVAEAGQVAVLNALNETVIYFDRNYLFSFDPKTNSFTRYDESNNYGAGQGWTKTGTFDPKRNKFVLIGDGYSYVADLSKGAATTLDEVQFSGDNALLDTGYPGLQYDSVRERVVGWNGGDAVYVLDLDSNSWSVETYSGGPNANPNGTYKRFSYVPSLNGYVVVNHVDENAWFLRLN